MPDLTIDNALHAANRAQQAGQLSQAEAAYRQILEREPRHLQARCNLAIVYAGQGRFEEAIATQREALAIEPNSPEGLNNLGLMLVSTWQTDEAIAAFEKAMFLRPNDPAFYRASGIQSNLGLALQQKGDYQEALRCFRDSLRLNPQNPDTLNSFGSCLFMNDQPEMAATCFAQALTLRPKYANAHFNAAVYLLSKGDYARGWPEYEWRSSTTGLRHSRRDFPQPRWDGKDLSGKTILLHAEQGFGDTLQFVRYAALVVERGGRVVVECQEELHRLLSAQPGISQCAMKGSALPAFDVHCPLPSLPLAFETRLETIPAKTPYLQADAQSAEQWRQRFPEADGKIRIGLTWATGSRIGREKSVPSASMLAPLLAVDRAHFYSLQKSETPGGARPAPNSRWTDWTADLRDFADTAALIANLDLVITIDTAVAHLAGAMGKPVWLMLPLVPDWRWLRERDDSPWYPTMRIFRPTARGDWGGMIERVVAMLLRVDSGRDVYGDWK